MTMVVRWQPSQCLASPGNRFLPGSIPVGLYLRKVRAGIVSATRTAQGLEKEVWCEMGATCFKSSNQGTFAMSLSAIFRRVFRKVLRWKGRTLCIRCLVARIRLRKEITCHRLYLYT